MIVALGGFGPYFFSDERHERVQQAQRLVHRPFRGGLHFGFFSGVLALQGRLGQLDIPVAKAVPDKLINAVGRIVKAIGLQCNGDGVLRAHHFADQPLRERQ